MAASLDILGLGCVAIDDCSLVDDYPREDAKTPVLARRRSLGGTTAVALAAAARYGAACGFAARLDRHRASFVLGEFDRFGVDTHFVQHADGVLPIHSQVIVSRRTASRTVLFDLAGAAGAPADWPPEEAIRSSRLLLVDHFGMEGMLRAARIARGSGIPIVADFEAHHRPEFPELLSCADHLLMSQDVAAEVTGKRDAAAACQALWSDDRHAVVVTCGRDGCWSLSAGDSPPKQMPAFRVETIDTTGCGDVFRGVYAAALVAGIPPVDRLRRASAAAALVASRPFEDASGCLPTRPQIEAFLAARSSA